LILILVLISQKIFLTIFNRYFKSILVPISNPDMHCRVAEAHARAHTIYYIVRYCDNKYLLTSYNTIKTVIEIIILLRAGNRKKMIRSLRFFVCSLPVVECNNTTTVLIYHYAICDCYILNA